MGLEEDEQAKKLIDQLQQQQVNIERGEKIAKLNDISIAYGKKLEIFSKEVLPECTKGEKNFLKLHVKGSVEQLKIFYDKLDGSDENE